MSSDSHQQAMYRWMEKLVGEEVLNHRLNINVKKSQQVPTGVILLHWKSSGGERCGAKGDKQETLFFRFQ